MVVPKPNVQSPVIIKFSTPGALLDLLAGFSAQRTQDNVLVSPSYGGTQLLELLNLFGGGNVATLIIPPSGEYFDGVRLTIQTPVVGVTRKATYYYAFYITPPQENTIEFCEDFPVPLTIPNYQSGYTYKVYNAETDGVEFTSMTTNTNTIPLESNLGPGTYTYWVEALENNLYPSGRTEYTVTVHPKPTVASITGANHVCESEDISLTSTTTGGIWTSSNETVATIDPTSGQVHGVTPGVVSIRYTVTDTETDCPAFQEKEITVYPKPGRPHMTISGVID